jgi:hypothetical protein
VYTHAVFLGLHHIGKSVKFCLKCKPKNHAYFQLQCLRLCRLTEKRIYVVKQYSNDRWN